MALSHADACPKTPHIEINDIKSIIEDQGKNQVTVRIQVVTSDMVKIMVNDDDSLTW